MQLAQFQRRANEDATCAAKDLEAAKRSAFPEVEKLRAELLRCAQASTSKLDELEKAHAEKVCILPLIHTLIALCLLSLLYCSCLLSSILFAH